MNLLAEIFISPKIIGLIKQMAGGSYYDRVSIEVDAFN